MTWLEIVLLCFAVLGWALVVRLVFVVMLLRKEIDQTLATLNGFEKHVRDIGG